MNNRMGKSLTEYLSGWWAGLFGSRSESYSGKPTRRSDMLFQTMIQSINGIVWECTADLQFTYVSPQCRQILGHDPDLWCSTPGFWQVHIHPDDRDRTINYCSTQLAMGANHDFEYRMQKSDGEYIWLRDIVTVQKKEDGTVQMCGVMFDVSREKQLEHLIKKSVEERERYLTYAPYLIGISNREGYFEMVNPAFTELLGYTEEELTSRPFIEFIHPDDVKASMEEYKKNRDEGGMSFEFENRYRTADGEWKWISWYSSHWIESEDRILSYGHEITSLKQANLELKREEIRLRQLESVITNTDEAIAIIESESTDLPGRTILYVNEGFSRMTGYSNEEVVGRTLHFLNGPETDNSERQRLRNEMNAFRPAKAELVNYRKNGEKFWIHVSMVPVMDRNGTCTHWISIGRNITERKEQQQVILESLKEKETLLSEVHHRVKNNLAVVSGMMILQAEGEVNEEVRSRLLDSVGRIKTMATIHEQLYQSNTFSRLDFSENIRSLVENIMETFVSRTEVHLEFDCEPVELNINQAIPCSLVVNEVVTNSMKYAFDGRDEGVLQVRLVRCPEHSRIQLTISDDGVGLPEKIDKRKSGTLGMNLIDVLCEQLQAKVQYDSPGEGTQFMISFKPNDLKGVGNSSF